MMDDDVDDHGVTIEKERGGGRGRRREGGPRERDNNKPM